MCHGPAWGMDEGHALTSQVGLDGLDGVGVGTAVSDTTASVFYGATPTALRRTRWESRYVVAVVVTDVLAVVGVVLIGYRLGLGSYVPQFGVSPGMGIIAGVLMIGGLLASRSWDPGVLGQGAEEFSRLIRAVVMSAVALGLLGLAFTGDRRPAMGVRSDTAGWPDRLPLPDDAARQDPQAAAAKVAACCRCSLSGPRTRSSTSSTGPDVTSAAAGSSPASARRPASRRTAPTSSWASPCSVTWTPLRTPRVRATTGWSPSVRRPAGRPSVSTNSPGTWRTSPRSWSWIRASWRWPVRACTSTRLTASRCCG